MRQKENLLNKCERQAILSFSKLNKTVHYEQNCRGLVVSVGDLEPGVPGSIPKSRHCGHCAVLLDKAHFLAYNWFVQPAIMNK